MVAVKDADFSNVDAIFCCLPHGTTQVFFSIYVIMEYSFLKTIKSIYLFQKLKKILVSQNLCL